MIAAFARVLIVDERDSVAPLTAMLRLEGYVVETAHSGEEALAAVAANPPDLVLANADLPGMNSFHLTRRLKADTGTANIPVILMMEAGNKDLGRLGMSAGAEDILERPFDPYDLTIRVRNLLRLKTHSNVLSNAKRLLEQQMKGYVGSMRDSHLETIFALTRASRFKDEETGAHIRRISHYSAHLATVLGMDADFVDTIFFASPMHDIGKIGVPDDILLKPGPHTAEEAAVMRQHTIIGAAILGKSGSPFLAMGAEIALRHHERWDGSGYPDGLAGEAIPLAARIMAICDVYDALRSRRPYKDPMDHEAAVRVIAKGDGRTSPAHFDPAVLAAFLGSAEQFQQTFEEYQDDLAATDLPHF